jgi:nucleoside-diphosphate-sugar epimerase
MNILVTGGAGMIGSNLVKRLVTMGHEVHVVDNLWRGRREYLLDKGRQPVIDFEHRLHVRDLTEAGAMDDLLAGIDYVFHLADIVAGIGYVFNHQGSIFRQNLLINSNVIDSVRRHPVDGFIYVGTACSFPRKMQFGVEAPPLKEEDLYPADPESAYGWSKLMGEYETQLLEEESGVPTAVLSLHNVYGAPCDYSESSGQVIPSLIRKAIEYPAQPFVVWGSGAQGRAFVHVDDIVDGLVAAMDRGMGQGAIQLGPDVCTTIREVAETIVEVSAKDIEIEFDTTRPEGDRGRCADYSKARRVLGWSPRVSLRDGMERTYRWVADSLRKN